MVLLDRIVNYTAEPHQAGDDDVIVDVDSVVSGEEYR